jgi:very-short-patch-repair endonuclease
MSTLHNRIYLKPIRKSLRNNATSAEATLWTMLKKSQVGGYKFRRQHSIGKYVVDFYCPTLHLVIELDGEPHADLVNTQLDAERDEFINNYGITVFRYENRWVFEYPDAIIEDILELGEKGKKNLNHLPATSCGTPRLTKQSGRLLNREEKFMLRLNSAIKMICVHFLNFPLLFFRRRGRLQSGYDT